MGNDWTPIGVQTFDSLVTTPREIDLRGVEGATDMESFYRLTYEISARHPHLRDAAVALDSRQRAGILAEGKRKGMIPKKTKTLVGAHLFGHELLAEPTQC